MKKNKAVILATAVFAVFSLNATCCAAEPKAEASQPSAVYTAKETAKFKALAKETITALDAGKNSEMIAKLTDLETAWDAKEETLKPKDPATWALIDKTLDKAIFAAVKQTSRRAKPRLGT